MAKKPNFSGVIAPVLTPYGEDGAPDTERFVEHCLWLLEEGCTGLAPFGTTSEGNSLGLDERMELLEELVDSDINPATLMGVSADLGTLEPGKLADLVIVDGNPLENIADTLRVRTVLKNGEVFTVDQLLKGAPSRR